MPDWGITIQVVANPLAPGLVGLDTWLWLKPAPDVITVHETYHGVEYIVTATPIGAEWDFGDGARTNYSDSSGYGQAYPQASSVSRVYQAHDQAGYRVKASIRYAVTWTALIQNRSVGPYELGTVSVDARPLSYPVQQAQPELVDLSGLGQDAQPTMPSIPMATTGPAGGASRYWA